MSKKNNQKNSGTYNIEQSQPSASPVAAGSTPAASSPAEKTSADKTAAKKPKKSDSEIPRRSFAKTLVAGAIGVAAIGAPLCGGVRMTIFPTGQEGNSGKFYTLTTVDQVDETPKKFIITDDVEDAWVRSPNQPIGSVFLRKSGDEIKAFQTLCPHAGCGIQASRQKNPKTGVEEMLFTCPCHTEYFDIEGNCLGTTSPRGMDPLEVVIEDGKVKVKFQNFKTGTAERMEV